MTTAIDPREELKKCVKCGACMAVCPIYRQTGREEMVARGKLALIERHLEQAAAIPASDNLSPFFCQAVDYCLLCHSCEDNCSKGVLITEIIKGIRAEITSEKGLHPVKKFFFSLLPGKTGRLKNLLKIGWLLQLIGWRRLPAGSGLRRRLPMPLTDEHTVIPVIPRHNLQDRLRKRQPPAGLPTLLYFPGCATGYLTPNLGLATITVLEKLGFAAIVPHAWACCGAVTQGSGDRQSYNVLEEKNLAIIRERRTDLDLVVTSCATCGYTLKHYPLPESVKVMDITEFLYEQREKLEKLLGGKSLEEKVTYHSPCHLRSQKVTREPRWLLQLMAGDRFVELQHPERCCGSGGSFGITHKALSRDILGEKMADLEHSGAGIIASGCPGCLIQLREGIHYAGLPATAEHPITLLARLLS
ncbi:MAG: (Fe-S)-binding protein [Deltaproteobacteria bacterium]|nr:(Fe-S)-binding protein [Candidatus Anaeroferrophillus wilburensis]MBN2889782.1 (Fe-S)-binding protein [Deltaproteobacteria bacterium]